MVPGARKLAYAVVSMILVGTEVGDVLLAGDVFMRRNENINGQLTLAVPFLTLILSGEPVTPRERVPRWRIGERFQWFSLVVEGKQNTSCGPTGRSPTSWRLWRPHLPWTVQY
ncbi:hypothetical protein TNCV_2762611 [Trichonephila clavipes]|nr:hypothetical protein TNCV_2762611 [Trichonephila clavipes]